MKTFVISSPLGRIRYGLCADYAKAEIVDYGRQWHVRAFWPDGNEHDVRVLHSGENDADITEEMILEVVSKLAAWKLSQS